MLKLAKLPDRTPVKIAFIAAPELARALHAYAALYRDTYGTAESIAELIPFMLESFLRSDHGFAKARKEREIDGRTFEPDPVPRRGRKPRAEPSSTAN